MSTFNRKFERSQETLLASMEALWGDLQSTSRILDITVGIAEYRHNTGIESNDLLLEVADYAIRGTDLDRDDILTISKEESGLTKFTGNLVRTLHDIVVKLITKFTQWLADQTSEQLRLRGTISKLLTKLNESPELTTDKLAHRLSGPAARIFQIDYKVITKVPELLSELEKYSNFTKAMMSQYADKFLQLVGHLNDVLSDTPAMTDTRKHTKDVNGFVAEFIKSTDSLVSHSDLDKNARSDMMLGNNNLYRYGATPDLMSSLNTDQSVASVLTGVTFKLVNDTSDDVILDNKFEVDLPTIGQAKNILKQLDSVLEDIIKYNKGMGRNIETQMDNMEDSVSALEKLDKNLSGKKIRVDGESTLTDIKQLRELYRYQAPVWRWGTAPVTDTIRTYNNITKAFIPLVKSTIKVANKKVEE